MAQERAGEAGGDLRRRLPSVHQVLSAGPLAALGAIPARARSEAAAEAVARARLRLASSPPAAPVCAELLAREAAETLLAERRPPLRRVVNATGIVLHTNLGRAVLAPEAAAAAAEAAAHYSNLEFSLDEGKRGSRSDLAEGLLRAVTGAEAAYVVNNNAGAVFLLLRALAAGREVVVSRGELVEIGGSFRVPDVMAESGARLVEVGTTNRTHLDDYARAIGPDTALLLKAHPSNFRVRGFVAEVGPTELAALGRAHGLRSAMDLGSGLLVPVAGIDEPTVADLVASGLDAVLFSGDKLLGGPQAGIVVGRREVVDLVRRHPLARALRVDKMTLAALCATLALYRDGREDAVPALCMLRAPADDLRRRAGALARALRRRVGEGASVSVRAGLSEAGGGSAPDVGLATTLVAVVPKGMSVDRLHARLRQGEPSVVARIGDGALLLDPRTLRGDDARILVERLAAASMPETPGRDV